MITGLLLASLAFGVAVRDDSAAASSTAESNGSILYVTSDASATETCSDWADPCGLQAALAADTDEDEIWAAAGVYYPGSATDPLTVTFQLKTGVALYGAFAGGETAREQRAWLENPATLSGDIDRNGVLDGGIAYHVVTGSGVDATAILDGFTITAGNASDVSPVYFGGVSGSGIQ
jgi:hypothetical protein